MSKPALRMRFMREGFVYFAQAVKSGFIKIGFSILPPRRIANLQTASFERLRLVSYLRGTMRTESELHKRFAAHRLIGEWYRPNGPVLRLIYNDPRILYQCSAEWDPDEDEATLALDSELSDAEEASYAQYIVEQQASMVALDEQLARERERQERLQQTLSALPYRARIKEWNFRGW
jgi:hypothetical protein